MLMNLWILQADQEGDVKELNALLLQLQKQQKQALSRSRGRPKIVQASGSDEAVPNGHHSANGTAETVSNENGHSLEEPAGANSNGNGVSKKESAKKPRKRSQATSDVDDDPKRNGHVPKKVRPAPVELPPRVSRSRGCKEVKVANPSNGKTSKHAVDLSSDGDSE